MADPNTRSSMDNFVISDKGPKKKSFNKPLLILIIFIFLVSLVTAAVLYIKSKTPHKEFQEDISNRDVVPDLYVGKSIEIKEPLLYRARFARYSDKSVTLAEFFPVGTDTTEITLDKRTVFGCIIRYMTAPDGKRIDRLNMYVTTAGNENIQDAPDPPDSKDFEWFKKTVKSGEAVEVRYIKTNEGNVIPRIIYIYEDTCT